MFNQTAPSSQLYVNETARAWSGGARRTGAAESLVTGYVCMTSDPGEQNWTQSGSDWHQMGQICRLFQIRINKFWFGEPKCTESDLNKKNNLIFRAKMY